MHILHIGARAMMRQGMRLTAAVFLLMTVTMVDEANAQQRIGYVDSAYILEQTPEFATVQQQVDRLAQEWRDELENQRRSLDELFREYQARELLYTDEERRQRQDEIMRAEDELERARMQYFGPEGELFQQQESLMRPIQERVLAAIEEVAIRDGYDYVFDRSGDFLFMFARDQYNLSEQVLTELGIENVSTN